MTFTATLAQRADLADKVEETRIKAGRLINQGDVYAARQIIAQGEQARHTIVLLDESLAA